MLKLHDIAKNKHFKMQDIRKNIEMHDILTNILDMRDIIPTTRPEVQDITHGEYCSRWHRDKLVGVL